MRRAAPVFAGVVRGRLREAGVSFRNMDVAGFLGRQILADDPSGIPIELFHPASR